jgi:hypothetical protein
MISDLARYGRTLCPGIAETHPGHHKRSEGQLLAHAVEARAPTREALVTSYRHCSAAVGLAGGSGQEQQRQPDEVGQHISRSHQVCHPLAEPCGITSAAGHQGSIMFNIQADPPVIRPLLVVQMSDPVEQPASSPCPEDDGSEV